MDGLYYLCSENKAADQLRGYREADLCLYFRICKKPVFSRCGSYFDQSALKETPQQDLDGMANSEDPDDGSRGSLIWVYTVYLVLSVCKLRKQ